MDKIYEEKGEFVDFIFADPPYFLSNGGITCKNGKMVNVDKGDWDKSKGADFKIMKFNHEWIKRCKKILKPNGFNDGIRNITCYLFSGVRYATIKYETS